MSFYSQEFPHLLVALKEHVLWLSLNNPQMSNAISEDMIESLTSVLNQADKDPQVRVVVIKGEGVHFCAGGDVKSMQNRTGMFAGEANELRTKYIFGIQKIPQTLEAFSKPLIAMVNGAAIGAGCDLAMMCDIRVGSEKSKFGETFVKLGLIPGIGGGYFLQRVVGYAKAMDMALSGDIISGEACKTWGLLSRFVSDEILLLETQKLAEQIAQLPPVAVQLTKKTVQVGYHSDLGTMLSLSAAFQGIAQRTADHALAVESLIEKKPSTYSGH